MSLMHIKQRVCEKTVEHLEELKLVPQAVTWTLISYLVCLLNNILFSFKVTLSVLVSV